MRKWHRWLSVVFGVFLLWIAVTGSLMQILPFFLASRTPPPPLILPNGQPFVCPPGYMCQPIPKPGSFPAIYTELIHLHTGFALGPFGPVILLAGVSLIFFIITGLYTYIRMSIQRAKLGRKDRWFWK